MRAIKRTGLVAAALSATMLFAGCGSSGGEASSGEESGQAAGQQSSQSSQEPMQNTEAQGTGAMASLVGPGCKTYAEQVPSGAGSVQGMSEDPVAVAAGNNPLLKTLTQAVSGQLNPQVDLVDTLNGGEFTVFAPVDDAFAALPKSMVNQLGKPKNADMLSSVLTYHVVEGQLSPDEVTGSHSTVQGEKVEVTGSGDNLQVNDASVICGGVQTANATVYLIDGVLTPPSAM
ncbi:MAG TPA: fasciclin domain-containing protein [Nocardioidaceae bacterium]|nr:fasciclin domain-containing protein [Nocardioidaceae bacterium]